MELTNSYPPKKETEKIVREEMAFGHYNDSFKLYFLKKIELFQYTDGKTDVRFKEDIGQVGFSVVPYDDFLNDKQGTKDKIFTKEELLSDFFEKIKQDINEEKIRFLSQSAFDIFDRKEMSQFFVDNLEKHKEDWPETITMIEDPGDINRNFEIPEVVAIKTEEVIRGAF